MTHKPPSDGQPPRRTSPGRLRLGRLCLIALVALLVLAGPVAAQEAPTGDGDGSADGWETILGNIYDVLYTTLQYAGLSVLVLGLIIWFTARSNSQRSETGMKLTLGGGAMIVAYFGLGTIISLLKFIAG
jgi:hypothetical protein